MSVYWRTRKRKISTFTGSKVKIRNSLIDHLELRRQVSTLGIYKKHLELRRQVSTLEIYKKHFLKNFL